MKEELTREMHSEFEVDAETEIKHRVFALLTLAGTEDRKEWEPWRKNYDVSITDIESYIDEFTNLQKGIE